mgnify:CR=1 FL=1
MGMFHDYMRCVGDSSLRNKKEREGFLKVQSDKVSRRTVTERRPIPDMREQLNKVRKSKVSLNRNLINATSSVTKDRL